MGRGAEPGFRAPPCHPRGVRTLLTILIAATAALGCGGSGGANARATPAATTTPGASPATTPRAETARRHRPRLKKMGDFDAPLYVTAPPGARKRFFVVEQDGTIRVVSHGHALAQPFLDIRDKVSSGGERGLLSMAFAPDYTQSGLFYVDYTDTNGNTRIVEYHRAAKNQADPASARQLIFQRQPEPNHNGGLLLFGPDGRLYVGFGDGGG